MIVGLLSNETEADEMKLIAKVFLVSVRVHELFDEQKNKVNK